MIVLGNFIVTLGMRFEHFKADLVDLNKTYHRFLKTLGLKYLETEDLALFVNYPEIFKGFSFGEIALVASGCYTGNLEPTRVKK